MGHKLAALKHVSHNSRLSPGPFGNVSMRKVKSNCNCNCNCNVKSQFKSNVKTNNKIKTDPEQLNGGRVFFTVSCESYSVPS